MKRLNYYIIILAIILSTGSLLAQQAPIFTQYRESMMFTNPAFAGMREGICVNGLMRQQWAGFKDYATGENAAPQNYLISLDSPIKILHGGLGGAIIQDRATYNWNDISLLLSYSFHAELSFGTIGIGLGGVLKNRSIDGSKYQAVNESDPVILKSEQGDMRLDANLGIYYESLNNYQIGISVTNLLTTSFKKLDPSGEGLITTDRTFYLYGGYTYVLPRDPRFEIEPSVLVQTNFISTQYNVSAIVNYNSRFWGGLNYRVQESVGAIVGLRYKDFRIGYSYDLNTKRLGVPGSHEVSLNYCFKIKADRSKTTYKNTRYL